MTSRCFDPCEMREHPLAVRDLAGGELATRTLDGMRGTGVMRGPGARPERNDHGAHDTRQA
jgi:hypothetical protein